MFVESHLRLVVVRSLALCLVMLSSTLLISNAPGQEFSIYTKVFEEEGKSPKLVCRSHTMLHANRGYDYIAELGQVTISDFGSKKVTVLHGSRKLAASFTFDELQTQIEKAKQQAEEFLLNPIQQTGFNTELATDFIQFQLHPEFEEVYDTSRKHLTLMSNILTYEATCAPPPAVKTLDMYLRFTDWTAQVNYVLVPQAMLPGPRMQLNEVLRLKEVLPIQVVLTTHIGRGVKLRAEHQYQWELEKIERQMIHDWDMKLESSTTKHVSLKEFQEILAEDQRTATRPTNVK